MHAGRWLGRRQTSALDIEPTFANPVPSCAVFFGSYEFELTVLTILEPIELAAVFKFV